MKTLQQTVLDFDKCDIQVLLAAMTSVCGLGGGEYNVISEGGNLRTVGGVKS